ncbi:uncharacterized protein LOC124658157 [Lolium rigidum]|uniref:uncharacterized protein LOC124658157 n=1 Tax=Lolium rigidum TaxID=89674 RepID=UPI001F5DFAAE|nr:uncharacterized protein LOC124658157 [Lolium rigidum]
MLSERGVSTICSNRKRKFRTINGVLGDLQPANPCEQEEFGSSSDSGQLVWSILSNHAASNWAESIVSLASFDEGGSIHPACTGIVVDHTKSRAYLLASLSLFRSRHDDRRINYDITPKVRLPNNQVVNGILLSHNSTLNLALVRVLPEGACVRAACLDYQQQQLESQSQVAVVQRCFSSGNLMATTGMLDGYPMGAHCEKAAAGGVLLDFLGNVVGLNCYGKEGTTFVPSSTMLEFLAGFQKACDEKRARSADNRRRLVSWWELPMKKHVLKGKAFKLKKRSPSDMSCLEGSSRMEKKQFVCHYCDPEGLSAPGDRFRRLFPGPSWPAGDDISKEAARNMIRSRGYPFPVLNDCGMRLLCNFEEEFGEDVWSKLTEEVASGMSQCVVALASFCGDKRVFACTGIIIGCSEFTTRVLTSASLVRNSDDEAKVEDNLKIEVCLPDNEHATGTLEHKNLCYNIAVITIVGSRCTQTAKIYDQLQIEPHAKVAAVGRVYESGKLIATGGTLIDKPSELDCKELKLSTCKITKAGIGGPLIDGDGNFIGMDFYGLEETPYLPRDKVLEVLRSFGAKPDTADLTNDHNPNRWPVPKPIWCYPTWHQYMGEGVKVDHRPQPM